MDSHFVTNINWSRDVICNVIMDIMVYYIQYAYIWTYYNTSELGKAREQSQVVDSHLVHFTVHPQPGRTNKNTQRDEVRNLRRTQGNQEWSCIARLKSTRNVNKE